MDTLLLIIIVAIAYLVAYHTYGKYLARRIFRLNSSAITPSKRINDGNDYVPTKKEILFGHHFTSIAGTGPIVGPAIGVIWGWVPAIIWVVFGSIFMGAVHDFGAVVLSLRNDGESIGSLAARVISPRIRIMFLSIIFLFLLIFIAILCLVISILFDMYPQSVLSIWLEIPIAIWLGHMIYKKNKSGLKYSLIGLTLLYLAVVIGAYYPIVMPSFGSVGPVFIWTILLLIYAFVASSLPVWRLMQPRDYINGHELFVAMGLLVLGVIFSRPEIVAPAIRLNPVGAPPIWPFLFITIACGAISGFHGLVGSGTTSKQMSNESHSLTIGYGGMLTEGLLATLVIIAAVAGIGLLANNDGLVGVEAWNSHYSSWAAAKGLGDKVGAFVNGAANMLTFIGIPLIIGKTIMGVFVASFAGTSLDTSTRLQRYVIAELASTLKINSLQNKYIATGVAVISAGILALWDGKGSGGLILWPLFGSSNQLLASLTLLLITLYLTKRNISMIYTIIPFVFMMFMTGWAIVIQIGHYFTKMEVHLFVMGSLIFALEIWMIIESIFVLRRCHKHSKCEV